ADLGRILHGSSRSICNLKSKIYKVHERCHVVMSFQSQCSLLSFLFALLTLSLPQQQTSSPTSPNYIGDDKCLSCHNNYRNYLATAHHLTSQVANAKSIAGTFAPGRNSLKTPQYDLQYRLAAKPAGFSPARLSATPPDTISVAERFDPVTASGRKG